MDQVVDLVCGKFEELAKALDKEKQDRAAEKIAAANAAKASGAEQGKPPPNDGLHAADFNMDPQQLRHELDKRLEARKAELLAEFAANAAAAKKAKTAP